MSDEAAAARQRLTARYLRELLLKPGSYRDAWQDRVDRPREGVINQLAVAEVLAGYLRSEQPRTGDASVMPYQLRDTVSGVVSGGQVTRQALELFIDAFRLADHEADRLRRLWNGSSTIRIASGSQAVAFGTEQEVVQALGPRRHHLLSLHDHVYVGADGRIERARIIEVLEAIVPGVDRIPFLCDGNVLTIEVGEGGKDFSGELHHISNDLYATEIMLARTLDLGETITLEYWLTYRFVGDFENPREREFRRGVFKHLENFNMRVEFSPARLPAGLWWARWDGGEGEVLEQETVTLDSQHSAHRYMHSLEKTVVGFYWEW